MLRQYVIMRTPGDMFQLSTYIPGELLSQFRVVLVHDNLARLRTYIPEGAVRLTEATGCVEAYNIVE